MALKPGAFTSTTTAQLRAAYDASNYTDFTTGATGDLTIAPTGGDTAVTGSLAVSTTSVLTGVVTASAGVVGNLTGDITGTAPAGTLTGATLASGVTSSSLTSVGTIGTGTWSATAIAVNKGGTAITSYAAGDILYASGTATLAKLAKGSDTQVLTLASGVPSWATPTVGDLTAIVAGTGLSGTDLSGPIPTLNVDASQTQITALGTIGTGVWQGTKVASAYLDDDTAHLSGTQTFSGAKTFSAALVASSTLAVTGASALNGGITHTASLDGDLDPLLLRNTSAGTSAALRMFLGTAASAYAGRIVQYGSSHATLASQMWIGTGVSSPVVLMTNGAANLTIASGGAATFSSTLAVTGTLSTDSRLTVNQSDIGTGENVGIKINSLGSTQAWHITSGTTGVNQTTFTIRDGTNNVNALTIATSTGNATLAGALAVTGAATLSSTLSVGTSATEGKITIGTGTGSSTGSVILRGNASQKAWKMTASQTISNALEFIPSTAAGGITFSTPTMSLLAAGMTVTGTLAVTGTITTTQATNSQVYASDFYNTTSGTAGAVLSRWTAGTTAVTLRAHSQGFTSASPYMASGSLLVASGAGGFGIYAHQGPFTLYGYGGIANFTVALTGATTISSTLAVTGATTLGGFIIGNDATYEAGSINIKIGATTGHVRVLQSTAGGSATLIDVTDAGAVSITGTLAVTGALSKGSGSFKIDHPLPAKADTHHLVHSFVEGPRADLIYRGVAVLSGGSASVDLDAAADMSSGTWELLCRDPQVWIQNDSGWAQVRGSVAGSTLTITCEDAASTDSVSWMVVAERCDPHMIETEWTDAEGRVIVEPEKEAVVEAPAATVE